VYHELWWDFVVLEFLKYDANDHEILDVVGLNDETSWRHFLHRCIGGGGGSWVDRWSNILFDFLIVFTPNFLWSQSFARMVRSGVKRPNQGTQVIFHAFVKTFSHNSLQGSSKRRKVAAGIIKLPAAKGGERASDKATISIPTGLDNDDGALSDQDLNLLDEYGEAAGFLGSLDHEAIARWVILTFWARVL
jgi:hypothetical protein